MVAGKYAIKADQGSTFSRSFKVDSLVAMITGVTNVANPVITTDCGHGLAPGAVIVINGVVGASGVNNCGPTPVWSVAAVPSPTTFTIAVPPPGVYISGGTVARPRILSGYSARMQVRTSVEATTVAVEATTGNGRIVIAAPTGSPVVNQATVTIDAVTMAALAAGAYRYDLEIVSPTGVVTRLVEGGFAVKAEVTR